MARRIRIGLAAVAVSAITFAIAPAAFAQGKGPGGGAVKDSKSDDGYGYEFDDDPLNAGGFGPNDATIRVRPRAARTTLIRPRTSFVPEMLKSVENI
jgi:hypothetical protein